jgi:hypothetical protein
VEPQKTLSLTSIHRLRSQRGRTGALSATRGVVRRHLWIIPLVAILGLVVAATWVRSRMERAIREQLQSELTTLLRADVEALQLWMRVQEDSASVVAHDKGVRQLVLELAIYAKAGNTSPVQLLQAPMRQSLTAELKPWIERMAEGYVVFTPEGLILAAEQDVLVGQDTLATDRPEFLKPLLEGKTAISHPFASRIFLPDSQGRLETGVPVMFVAAPIKDDDGKVAAVVALRIDPSKQFTEILSVAALGSTGETYAFDEQGVLLSQSRFEDDLKSVALMPDQPYARSVLNVELRDPGANLTAGERAVAPRKDLPLTYAVSHAIKQQPPITDPGVNVEGYRDYRGVQTVGAWAWLPEYDFGVVTEIDKSEAFRPMFVLRSIFWGLLGLLSLASVLLLVLTLLAGRLEKRMRAAVIAAGQLGQYALEKKIGEGGMGSVYRARHAMLRRPTAVKLLEPAKTTDVSVARFEREVQMTSQLNHPNTITIYDYGRTEEGVFYYAMEFLEGFPLDTLVQRFGPLPDGRVIGILTQVCGSLIEAHTAGLIHRDIKPANIMLTQRGGVPDFVKLLDFGLVKAIDSNRMKTLTAADAITGTPLYMAPETIKDAEGCDARGDLYALGAVGYYLLTGKPVFDSGNVIEIMRAHVETRPLPPSQRTERLISRELELLILMCLEKSPADRPQSAAEMVTLLGQCVPEQTWTNADATAWWLQQQGTVAADPGATDPGATVTQDFKLGATVGYSEVKRSAT